jgi:replicative DNA helicase
MSEAPDIERQVVGIAFQSPRDLADLHAVRAEWFRDPRCRETWRVIQHLSGEGEPVDPQTVMGNAGLMDELTRPTVNLIWLFDCYQSAPVGHLGETYAAQLHERHQRQQVGDTLSRAWQLLQGNASVREVRLEALQGLQAVDDNNPTILTGETVAEQMIDQLDEATPYVPTPWRGLNRGLRGWRPGGLYIVGARPGVGKSLMLQASALDLARRGPVLLETIEMRPTEVMTRLVSQVSGVPLGKLQGRREDGTSPLSPADWQTVSEAAAYIAGLGLRFGDRGVTTPLDVREHAREAAQGGPLAGIVVDYLQLMSSGRRVESRAQEVSGFTRDLKLMAQEFDCPVIVASQLNRESTKGSGRPDLAALRESGSIEQDADAVILLHQLIDADDSGVLPDEVPIDAILAKNRQGRTGTIPMFRDGRHARLIDDDTRKAQQ